MADRIRITAAKAKNLPLPADGKKLMVHWDNETPGFGVRVTRDNARSYVVRYTPKGAKERTKVIGTVGSYGLEEARLLAGKVREAARNGVDFFKEQDMTLAKERAALTMRDVFDRWHEAKLVKNPSSSWFANQAPRLWRSHLDPVIGDIQAKDLERKTVVALHAKISAGKRASQARIPRDAALKAPGGGKTTANRCLALLSALCNYAALIGEREDAMNPCKGVEKNPSTQRQRYLSPNEMNALLAALTEGEKHENPQRRAAARAIQLLIFTGARKEEVIGLDWKRVDFKKASFFVPVPKETKPKTTPLTEEALATLSRQREDAKATTPDGWVFRGRADGKHLGQMNKAWNRFVAEAGLEEHTVMHDMRHTFASFGLSYAGLSQGQIGALLGHRSAQTTMRYAHLANDAKAQSMNEIGNVMRAAIASPGAEVVPVASLADAPAETEAGT